MDPFYIAQGISVLTAAAAILSLQCKSMKGMIACQIASNLFTATSYYLLDGMSGAGICLIAIVQAIVMSIYSIKERKPDLPVLLIFIALYIGCSALYFKTVFDIFSGLAAVCFAISIAQKKTGNMRLWYTGCMLCWIVYDVVTKAYGNLVVHLAVLISGFVAMIRYRKESKA